MSLSLFGNEDQLQDNQLNLDFDKSSKEAELLKQKIEYFILHLIEDKHQPSASELLKVIGDEFGFISRYYFREVINTLKYQTDIPRYLKDYMFTSLGDDDISSALRGVAEMPTEEFKSTLDDLFRRSVTYRKSGKFLEAIQFASKFRDYAPYNNLLVKLQNPNCSFFATEKDWMRRFNRTIKVDARPMIILAPMSPVMVVYDLDETEGEPIPERFLNFSWAGGHWNRSYLNNLLDNANGHKILVESKTLGSLSSGYATSRLKDNQNYKMRIALHNGLEDQSKFSVLMHEMAHILLGHLGTDIDQWWPSRMNLSHSTVEIEAESVSYIVCNRLGIETSAPGYLSTYLTSLQIPKPVSIDLIFKVAGKLENMAKIKLLPKKTKSERQQQSNT